jgi:hypothetical protein
MVANKKKLIETFIGRFKDSVELPDWNHVSVIDSGMIRFFGDSICITRKDGVERHKITKKECSEIKQSITDFGKTDRFRKNIADYEAFEIRRKQLGVSDGIIDKMFISGHELLFTNIKTKEKTVITIGRSRYSIIKKIVKAIDNGELDINKIRFSISLDMINLLN